MERYVIHVTKLCNMECSYCYEKDKTSTYTWDEIENLCRNIIKSNINNQPYSIEFLGGEPMLAFDYVKKSVELFKKEDPNNAKYFIITSNGTIVNNDLIHFLLNNSNVTFAISLDGSKFANRLRLLKSNKQNSYDLVTYNIKKLLMYGVSKNQISVHMVTHSFNSEYIYESIEDIYSMGIRIISVGTVENAIAIGHTYQQTFIFQMQLVADSILNGTFKDLYIDLFEDFDISKPRNRIYIKDKNGKMLGESYGEMSNDVTHTNIYNSSLTTSDLTDIIFNIRKKVCLYYRNKKKELGTRLND